MWDTSLTLKFQLMKSNFGRPKELIEISYLFKPSSGGHYPQYILTENYCLNIEGLNESFVNHSVTLLTLLTLNQVYHYSNNT